jgi:dihydrofolate reductase
MRKLILKMSVSVDGFVAGPNGEIDWLFKTPSDPSAEQWLVDTLWNAGAHLMGRRTFNDMKAYWPTSASPLAAPMNDIPKIVFSRTEGRHEESTTRALNDATWSDKQSGPALSTLNPRVDSWQQARIITSPLKEKIMQLKAQNGDPLLAHGGATFAQSLIATGLIDEYRLVVHPVALGKGLPIFSSLEQPQQLTLNTISVFKNGIIAQTYAV